MTGTGRHSVGGDNATATLGGEEILSLATSTSHSAFNGPGTIAGN